MKNLNFEVQDPFLQLLLELYLNKRCLELGVTRSTMWLGTTDSEREKLLDDYLPNLLKPTDETHETCPMSLRYPFITIYANLSTNEICSASKTTNESLHYDQITSNTINVAFNQIDRLLEEVKNRDVHKVTLNKDYTAVYVKGNEFVEVGCQKIPLTAIKELYKITEI